MIFWDLNYSLGCSPLRIEAYPQPAFPEVYNVKIFGVGPETEGFLPLNLQSVALPSLPSRPRLDFGQLQQEPAITDLDWLFTPSPRLEEHLLVAPLRASMKYYLHFTLPRVRSIGFGSYPSDFRHFHTFPLASCGDIGFPVDAPLLDYPCH